MNWFAKETNIVFDELKTDRTTGLSSDEVDQRQQKYGPNEITAQKAKPAWQMFLESFKEPLVVILLVAIVIALLSAAYEFNAGSLAHGEASLYEAATIVIIVLINGGLTFHQTRSAQKSLDALRQMRQPHLNILRDGEWHHLPARDLVPGDVVSVKAGDFIQGDLRFLKVAELQVDESPLTGESAAIDKTTRALPEATVLADRTNMGFSGTMVVNGNAIGVVVATGMATELGKIANLMADQEDQKTPIEKAVAALGQQLMILSGGIIAFTVGFELMRQLMMVGHISIDALAKISSTAIAIAVASIPDAMPVVLSIVLTIGVKLLAKSNGLVKSLSSVETLGAASYIASDKTGTLTKNEMTVKRFYANQKKFSIEGDGYTPFGEILDDREQEGALSDYQRFFEVAVLNNEAEIKPDQN